jgi:elongation factor Tu
MPVEGVLSITGRGTVATGLIERGIVVQNDPVELMGLKRETLALSVAGIEMFRQKLDRGLAGDNVGVLLRGLDNKEDVKRGMVLCAPGSVQAFSTFTASVYILTEKEGGRRNGIAPGYMPQFYVKTTDVTGTVDDLASDDGASKIFAAPGDRIKMTITLLAKVPLENGTRFAIREGGKTIGAGVVTALVK